MSDELRLPDELAALEARLAAQSLPASGVNRDELMYRAGWAACEAQHRLAVPSHEPPSFARAPRVAAWSFASAALAASLAVAATLYLQSPRGVPMADKSAVPASQSLAAAPPVAPQVATPAQAAAVADYLSLVSSPDARNFIGPLTAFHRRPRLITLPRSAPETVANGASAPSPKTASQLREELLPAEGQPVGARRNPLVWPWSIPTTGESI